MRPLPSHPGIIVDVGEARRHVVRGGRGRPGPTVVLEAGLAATSGWWHWVGEAVGHFAPVVSHDRPGMGWSSESAAPRDAETMARELRELLRGTGVEPPYVLVGHSMGGLVARVFAARFPSEAAGLVLVDAVHPDQSRRSPQIRRAMARFFLALRLCRLGSRLGAGSLANGLGISGAARELPVERAAEIEFFMGEAGQLRTMAREAAAWGASCAQARETRFPNLPVRVVTAGRSPWRDWPTLQAELAEISPRSGHRVVSGATHLSLLANADFAGETARAIREVIAEL